MSTTNPTSTSTKSGITTSATGERHIPSSTRADGSVRKEIRVRPGYRPPEDVEVYKNRTAEAWKNRGKSGVPGAESLAESSKPQAGAANKNAKRREARKKAATGTTGGGSDAVNGAAVESGGGNAAAAAPAEQKADPVDPEAEKEREAKKLTKRLRQAKDLKERKEKGDSLLPEQFEKVIKINELIRQLNNLGFDSNGDKKAAASEEKEDEAT